MSDPSAAMFHKTSSGNVKESELINSGRDTIVQKTNNYNIGVFSDVISLIQFAAQYIAARTRSADGKERDPVDISDIVPPDPSSLPVSSIADSYTRTMLECRVGYPLYEPEPFSQLSKEYLRNGINVGDVGFVRQDGAFDFLFNICPPQNEAINPPNLPDGFSLETSEHSETRAMRPLSRETCFLPRTVKTTESGEYICDGSEGAILELPEGAIQDEAINTKAFEDLAKLHGVQWYEYTMTRGRSISNGSLYLVTSSTKCAQWGIAVFDRPCDTGQGLTFVSSPFGWKGSRIFTTKVANPNQGDTPNQCVFLRGYKIMIRQDIFDHLPTRRPAHRIRGGGGSDLMSRILTGGNPFTRTTRSTVEKLDEVVLRANFNSSPVHPSDLINAALLRQNPDARIALTHDDVWCDLVQANFPKPNYVTLINIAQSTIDEYGCVSLGKIAASSNVHNESSSLVRGTEILAPQEFKAGASHDLHEAGIEPASICVEETPLELPHKASSFRKAIAKVKKIFPRPSNSGVPARGLFESQRAKSQEYLPVLDTTGKPNIDDKNQPASVNAWDGEYGNTLQAVSSQGDKDIVEHLFDQNGFYGNALGAAISNGAKDIVELLLEKGADVNAQGGFYYGNALQEASYKGAKDIVELLLDKSANVNAQGGFYGNALQAASYKGVKDIVKLLLDKGADVNAQGGEYGNALQAATYKGVKDIVELLLEKGADVNAQGGEYGNATFAAIFRGATDIVKLLLDGGAEVNMQGGFYGNALQAASYKGAKDIVELLLEQGADVNAQGGFYGNALQAAIYKGAKDIVELLLKKGADMNAQVDTYGNALFAAIHIGAKDIVELLLDKGADVNAQGGEYGNALQAAIHKGAKDIVELLLTKGADVNAQGGEYGNALQAAIHKGAKDIVELLLDRGGDVNTQGGEYGNVLQAAIHKGARDIVELLVDKGVDVNAQGGEYGNALQAAIHKGAKDIVELLLEKDADVKAQGGFYGNALQAASYKGAKDIVELLLEKGADVKAQGGFYGNALQAASYKGAKDIVELLLERGVDVNAHGGEYGNALQAASYKGAKDIVELLLNQGADVNAQGGEYSNPLQAALYKGAKDIAELLLDNGADVNALGGEYYDVLQAASNKDALVKDIVELLFNLFDKSADADAHSW
ncbi:Ankyrin repeat-containing domain protein [Amanita muscaria]